MDAKFIINRVTVVRKDGSRRSFPVKGLTNNLDVRRKCLEKVHNAERVYFTYDEKED